MAMANLIKRIAMTNSRLPGMAAAANEYKSANSQSGAHASKQGSVELDSFTYHPEVKSGKSKDRVVSFPPKQNEIRSTTEYTVTSELNPFAEQERRGSEVQGTSGHSNKSRKPSGAGWVIDEAEKRSLESAAGAAESLKGSEMTKRAEDSDDEVVLVGKSGRW
jgi:hypothetical protein